MRTLNKHLKQHQHIILLFAVFIIIYAISLTFVYVEGDDGSTIIYHLLGRDESLRPRYALYQAMFDSVLSLLPANEPLLRVFSISLSALGAAIFTGLAVNIAFRRTLPDPQNKLLYTLLFLSLSPELFFSGLYINPTIIAYVFIFLAHYLLIGRDPDQSISLYRTLGSALLFGFGVALRWNAALYGIVILLDLCLPDQKSAHSKWRIRTADIRRPALTWLGMASLFSLIFVNFSVHNGLTASGIFSLTSMLLALIARERISYISLITIPRFISLFSPILILLSGLGLVSFVKKKAWKIVILFTVQLISLVLFLLAGKVKELMMLLPVMWVLFIEGTHALTAQQKSYRLRLAIIVLAFLPWLIGVQIYSGTTLWGPGFEIREPGMVSPILNEQEISYAPGIHFGFSALLPVLDAGFALATPEGPRPLGGYAYVLLGGRWREFTQEMDQYLSTITQAGVVTGHIIKLGAGSDARLVNKLIRDGLSDYSPANYPASNNGRLPYRSITNFHGNTTVIYYALDSDALQEEKFCINQPELCGQPIPLMTNYSSDLNALFQQLPVGQLSVLSPLTGVVMIETEIR